MLKQKTLALIAITTTLCVGLYTYSPNQRTLGTSSSKDPTMTEQPQPQVRLEFVSVDQATDDVPKVHLKAYVSNPSSRPVTILRWNSILDPQAGLLGAVSLRNRNSAKAVDVPSIMMNRQTPPPKEEYLRIDPGASINNEVTLALVTDRLEDGVEYDALAEGRFMEVYYGDVTEPASLSYSCEPARFKA